MGAKSKIEQKKKLHGALQDHLPFSLSPSKYASISVPWSVAPLPLTYALPAHKMEAPSFVSKARTALHSAAAKAERVITDIKSDLKSDRGSHFLFHNSYLFIALNFPFFFLYFFLFFIFYFTFFFTLFYFIFVESEIERFYSFQFGRFW